MKYVVAVLMAGAGLSACATADVKPSHPITFDHMVMTAAPKGEVVAAYAALTNNGPDDVLTGISCTCAGRGELHRVIQQDGKTDMANGFPLPVPSGSRVEIKPPGVPLHFMLLETNRAFVAGEKVSMTLHFAKAGPVDMVFQVSETSAKGWADWRP